MVKLKNVIENFQNLIIILNDEHVKLIKLLKSCSNENIRKNNILKIRTDIIKKNIKMLNPICGLDENNIDPNFWAKIKKIKIEYIDSWNKYVYNTYIDNITCYYKDESDFFY